MDINIRLRGRLPEKREDCQWHSSPHLSLKAWFHVLERKDCKRQYDGQGNDIDGGGKRGNEGTTNCAGYVAASLSNRAADGNGYRRFKAVVVFHTARAGVALAAHPDGAGIAGGVFVVGNLPELQPLQLGAHGGVRRGKGAGFLDKPNRNLHCRSVAPKGCQPPV